MALPDQLNATQIQRKVIAKMVRDFGAELVCQCFERHFFVFMPVFACYKGEV